MYKQNYHAEGICATRGEINVSPINRQEPSENKTLKSSTVKISSDRANGETAAMAIGSPQKSCPSVYAFSKRDSA